MNEKGTEMQVYIINASSLASLGEGTWDHVLGIVTDIEWDNGVTFRIVENNMEVRLQTAKLSTDKPPLAQGKISELNAQKDTFKLLVSEPAS